MTAVLLEAQNNTAKIEAETTRANSQNKFEVFTSSGFNQLLDQLNVSLVFTTYQIGKVLFVGLDEACKLSIFERSFPRAMGLGISKDERSLLLATQTSIYSFDDLLPEGQKSGQYDALFAPHRSWITGDIDIHDIGHDESGNPLFVNTKFNCIATTATAHSFKPVWKPKFISAMVAEDRCHLNGMAMKDGKPKYVSCVSQTDVIDSWRARRVDGGVIIDTDSNDIVATGLSMPHSPRLHNGRLWLLNSGRGEFGWVDTDTGKFNAIAFCPGFARGLTIVGDYAIVGLSLPREAKTFTGLPLQDILESKNTEPYCGLQVIDLNSGKTCEWMRIEGLIAELFDVSHIKRLRTPSAIGIVGPEIHNHISVAPNDLAAYSQRRFACLSVVSV